MIFDWKYNKDEALKSGLFEEHVFGTDNVLVKADNGVVANHTFYNFDNLTFDGEILIENCIFENCTDIIFDECQINNCSFKQIETIFATRSSFTNSEFSELVCEEDTIVVLDDSEISHCSFDNIELLEDSSLCNGTGDSWIEYTSFSNIRTSDEYQEIVVYEEPKNKIFKRKKAFDMIDEDTCTGEYR